MQPLLLSKIARACLWRLHEHGPSATRESGEMGIIYSGVVAGYYPLKQLKCYYRIKRVCAPD
ncbi:hypothetical protein OAG89_02075 [Pseudomonadales bacterium]|nr:hypothetical protein [Pseudomonadales bacterium]